MSTEEHKAIARRFVEEVINRQNVAVIDEIIAPDFIEHDELPPGTLPGPEGQKQYIGMFLAAFPDLHVTIEDLVAEGDKVVLYQTFRGTHRGEFMGTAPTGIQVTFPGVDIVRLAGSRFVEHWSVIDALGLLQQLGAVPALAPLAG